MIFDFLGSSHSSSTLSSANDVYVQTGSLSNQLAAPQSEDDVDHLPLFRLMIQRVWGAFPGLIDLPINVWLGIERFIVDFNRRNFSTSRERRQFTKRAVISIGFTKLLSSYINSIIQFKQILAQPSRPSPKDLELISQLPRLISLFGNRIKFIPKSNDQFLVIYLRKIQTSTLAINAGSTEISSSRVKVSLLGWRVLLEFLKTVGQNKEYNQTEENLAVLQTLFSSQHPQSEKLYQVLESNQLSPSSFDHDVEKALNDFLNEERKFHEDWIKSGQAVDEAKQGYKKFLKKIVYEGELDNLYNLASKFEKLETILELDPTYKQALSWVIIWTAYMLRFIFISGPDGDEVCELLIKVDKLLPYELIKQGLRIINPTLAIRTTVALVLGQPFGSLSLFQRILDSIVSHEIRTFDGQIQAVLQSLSPSNQSTVSCQQKMYEAIKKYVYLAEDEKRETRAEFDNSEEEIIILILQWSQDFDPIELESIQQSKRIFKDSGDSIGANLFHDLTILLRLTSLKRDREQILEMVLEPDNPIIRTIKQILENYYPTIYKIAQASNLSKKFGQTEAFLKDLIHLLVNRKRQNVSIEKLIKLLHQHKQSYWSFVNELVRYEDLCVPMKEWIRSCFNLVKLGLDESIDVPITERLSLDFEKISSFTSIEPVLEEARSLSMYSQLIKMVDNIQYRSVFCSSSFTIETNLLNQAFQLLCELDHPCQLKKHLTQSGADVTPPIPFGWAWWIDEKKFCGRVGETLNDREGDSRAVETGYVAPRQLGVNSDFKEAQKLTIFFYLNELSKSINLFDRPQMPSTPA